MNVALYQPEIPQNTAAILRTAACFEVAVHIVGPAAFDLSQRSVRRAGLDYAQTATLQRHTSFDNFSRINELLKSPEVARDLDADDKEDE